MLKICSKTKISNMTKNYQEKFIAYALNLAKKNRGATLENPVVGCVIVKDGEIISSGVTAKAGRPHAEKIAIEKISDKKILKDCEIYVTLEPCSHFGQTSPCVDEIIKHKFKKVVIATQDPDKRVNGNGIKKLREARIETVCGIFEKAAREINKGFFKNRETGLPYVTLKLATSLDGKIATKNFDSKWITGEKARQFAHHLRSINDAILVGANTVRKDDPMLDCRISGLEDFSPKRVILANDLNFDLNAKIFQTAKKIPVIILTGKKNADKRIPDIEMIFCDDVSGKINLRDALKKLAENGVNSVLIEGGQKTATEFLKENLVDELIWIRNKKIIGNDGISAISDLGFEKISDALNNFLKQEIRELEDDVIEIFMKQKT
jgi:diaminohydroxyphosphoribosylaminopyrimidine deaminase/5-amino-6-(5-phosphoribosylamino)uracil reductase